MKAFEIFATPSTTSGYSYLLLGGDGRSVATGSYDADARNVPERRQCLENGHGARQCEGQQRRRVLLRNQRHRATRSRCVLVSHARGAREIRPDRSTDSDGASGMALSDDDRFVYVLGTLSNSVSVFERRADDTADDTMVFVETLRQGTDGVRGMVRPADLALSPAANRFGVISVSCMSPEQDSNSVAVLRPRRVDGQAAVRPEGRQQRGRGGRSARSHGTDALSRRGQALRVDRRAGRYPGRVGRTRRRHRRSAMSK